MINVTMRLEIKKIIQIEMDLNNIKKFNFFLIIFILFKS